MGRLKFRKPKRNRKPAPVVPTPVTPESGVQQTIVPPTTRPSILGRSSIEAYITFVFAVIIAVVHINDFLRCLLVVVLLVPIVDLCWRSPWTARRSAWIKWTITALMVLVAVATDLNILTKPRTYIYFVPTRELIDTQERALFIKQTGPDVLHHLEVNVDDGLRASAYTIDEIDPPIGPQENDGFNYSYLWVVPPTPWDEKYTITITAREIHEVQTLTIHNTRHTGFQLFTAIKLNTRTLIGTGGHLRQIEECRDLDPALSCNPLMALDLRRVFSQLVPKPTSYETVDGTVTANPLLVPEPGPSGNPETESDARKLTEWQRSSILSALSVFAGRRILVLCSHGKYTESYATDFANVFKRAHWRVTGPQFVEPRNEDIVDVQVSVRSASVGEPQESLAAAVRDALVSVGVKGKHNFMNDPDAPARTILLWVGHKSPNGFNPDQCSGVEWNPKPNEPVNCHMTSVTPGVVGFIPP